MSDQTLTELPANAERLLTVAEVQRILAVGRGTAYNLVSTGQLPGVRIGRAVRVMPGALRRYLAANASDGAGLMPQRRY